MTKLLPVGTMIVVLYGLCSGYNSDGEKVNIKGMMGQIVSHGNFNDTNNFTIEGIYESPPSTKLRVFGFSGDSSLRVASPNYEYLKEKGLS